MVEIRCAIMKLDIFYEVAQMLVGSEIAIYWIIVAVIAIIVLLIYTGIENMGTFDFEDLIDTFFGESGWAFFFGVFLLGGIVFGFLNWIWWAMLLILGIPLIGLIVFIIIIHRDESKQIESSDDEEIIQTNMNCPNCGAKIIKQPFYDDDGNKNYQYKCDHCNTVFSKVDIFSITHPEEKQKIFDLDDWEEEYFEACDGMQFNAHNIHTEKQIKRKYDTLKEFI